MEKTCKELVRVGLNAQLREMLDVVEPFARIGFSLRTTYGTDIEELHACSFPAKDYLRAAELHDKYRKSNQDGAIVSITLGNTDGNEGKND